MSICNIEESPNTEICISIINYVRPTKVPHANFSFYISKEKQSLIWNLLLFLIYIYSITLSISPKYVAHVKIT